MNFVPLPDGDSAVVTAAVDYFDGSADILKGRHWRDSAERLWTHVHRCGRDEYQRLVSDLHIADQLDIPGFWAELDDDDLVGPVTAGLKRSPQTSGDDYKLQLIWHRLGPSITDEPNDDIMRATLDSDVIVADADRIVADHWQYHPSTCRLRELEVAIRGEDAVRAGPILRPLVEDADDAIERAKFTAEQACGARVTCTICRADNYDSGEGFHVHMVRDGAGIWHIRDVEPDRGKMVLIDNYEPCRLCHNGDHVSVPRPGGRHMRIDIVDPDDIAWSIAA